MSEPTFTLISPAEGTALGRHQRVVLEVTQDPLPYHAVMVAFKDLGIVEVVYDGIGEPGATPTNYDVLRWPITNGYRYSIARNEGWKPGMGPPTFRSRSSEETSVAITYPNGGEAITIGEVVAVTWAKVGTFVDFDLEVSTNNGSSWSSVATGISGAVTTYNWTVATAESTQVLLRLTGNTTTFSVSDTSNAAFTVSAEVWPGSTEPDNVSYCVSYVRSDTQVTDGGAPSYTLTDIIDQETGYGSTAWSGENQLARVNPPSSAFGGSASSAYAYKPSTDNNEGLYSLLGTSNSTVSGGSNHYGSFVIRCKEVGVYGWFGTSFAQQNYIKITPTQVQWTHGKSDSGYETLSINHGLDTSIYHTFFAIFEGNSFPSVTWYADGTLLGTSNGVVNYDFPMTSPELRLGRASGATTAVLAAAFFAKQLSAGERASFLS